MGKFTFPSGLRLTFLGHSSFKIETRSGKIILIDPWLKENPVIPEAEKDQEKADLILITHGHEDHFDTELPELLERTGARVIAPNEVRFYLQTKKGIKTAKPMNVGGTVTTRGQKITMTQAVHNSYIFVAENEIGFFHQPVGYVLETEEGLRLYFAGDTNIFSEMQLIHRLYRPDIVVLPIGDRFTMGPLEASVAIELLQASYVIPCHYGSLKSLTGTPEALRELTRGIPDLTIREMEPGETLTSENVYKSI